MCIHSNIADKVAELQTKLQDIEGQMKEKDKEMANAVEEWQAHWEAVLETGWVPCPLSFGTPESHGYYAAIERRSAAAKAAVRAGRSS